MRVMTLKYTLKKGDFTYKLLGVNEPTHMLINNHMTNTTSTLVPVSVLFEVLNKGIRNE